MPIELGSFSLGSIAGGLVGVVAGHYLCKARDKEARYIRDFNSAADLMAETLIEERRAPSPAHDIDFSAFRRVLSAKDLASFNKCVERYNCAKETAKVKYPNDTGILIRAGSGSYEDHASIIKEVDNLLKFLKRK